MTTQILNRTHAPCHADNHSKCHWTLRVSSNLVSQNVLHYATWQDARDALKRSLMHRQSQTGESHTATIEKLMQLRRGEEFVGRSEGYFVGLVATKWWSR